MTLKNVADLPPCEHNWQFAYKREGFITISAYFFCTKCLERKIVKELY